MSSESIIKPFIPSEDETNKSIITPPPVTPPPVTPPPVTPLPVTPPPNKSDSGIGGLLFSICYCVCSCLCIVLIIRGLMPRNTKN